MDTFYNIIAKRSAGKPLYNIVEMNYSEDFEYFLQKHLIRTYCFLSILKSCMSDSGNITGMEYLKDFI